MGRMKELSIEHAGRVENQGDHWRAFCPCGFMSVTFGPDAEEHAHDALGEHWVEVLGVEDAVRHAPLRLVETHLPDLAPEFERALAVPF